MVSVTVLPACTSVCVDDGARRGDERARRAGRKSGAELLGAAALRSHAGQEQNGTRHEAARGLEHVRMRGTDHRPDRGEPARADVVRSPAVDETRDVLPERPPVGERQILEVFAASIRGLHDWEHAEPVVREEGLERVVAQVRVHGDRVGERRERGGVGARSRGNIAALRVGDDEQARLPRVAAHLDERGPARDPLRLEERRLGLDGDRDPGDGVDDAATELHDAEPRRHERRIRVEADAERCALPLHRGCEPIREMTRPAHAYQDTSRPRRGVPKRRGRPEAASRSSEETLAAVRRTTSA